MHTMEHLFSSFFFFLEHLFGRHTKGHLTSTPHYFLQHNTDPPVVFGHICLDTGHFSSYVTPLNLTNTMS